jgi:hypothetical protein
MMKKLVILFVMIMVALSAYGQTFVGGAYLIDKAVDEVDGHDWMLMPFEEKMGLVYGWYFAYYAVMQSLVDEEVAELGRDLTQAELDAYYDKFSIDIQPADIGRELERFYSDEANRDVMLVWKIIEITGKDWWKDVE